jgi:hypothetical protein
MDQSGIKDMTKGNPKVERDQDVLEEALSAIRELRKSGIKPSGYTLASPFQRRRSQEASRIVICKAN